MSKMREQYSLVEKVSILCWQLRGFCQPDINNSAMRCRSRSRRS